MAEQQAPPAGPDLTKGIALSELSGKTLGVTAQREIEKAVRQALADGRLEGHERWPAKATVVIDQIGFRLDIDGQIELE